jgi:hypothetical protein
MSAAIGPQVPEGWELRRQGGLRPFITYVEYQRPDGSVYRYETRLGRKGHGPRRAGPTSVPSSRSPWARFWAPDRLAWWVAILFVVGSICFILGAAASLVPSLFGSQHTMSVVAEIFYTAGAALYTVSVYGQLLEYLNEDDRITDGDGSLAPESWRWWAWRPTELGWLVPFVFLVGAVVFNYETIAALLSSLGLVSEHVGLWTTSMLGSVLFLAASVLQIVEVGHGSLRAQPRNISWWVAVLFVIGSIGFIIGSLPGFGSGGGGLPNADQEPGPLIVKVGFLLGGIAYAVGSYLMLPEMFQELSRQQGNGDGDGSEGGDNDQELEAAD